MKNNHFNFLRWMPVAASVALMILIAIVSMGIVAELNKDIYWRKHTFNVILEAQAVKDNLVNAERNEHSYLETGRANLLVEYRRNTNAESTEFKRLTDLTKDDPAQQARLKDLSTAMQAVFAHDDKVIGVYARQGQDAARKADQSSESRDDMGQAVQDLEKITGEEEKLLATRDSNEQSDYRKAARVLILGSIAVAGLLIFSNYVAGREMARRRRAEEEQHELIKKLQTALEEVKTLSGLIPICGWCKNVRSDTGYWQSVEQYFQAHTEATVSHGICPVCQDKFDAESMKIEGGS